MERFADKIALVTGAASGIGRATALRLAAEGASLILLDRSPSGEEVAASIRSEGGAARFIAADVTDDDAVGDAIALAGPVDVLVNNAGGARAETFADLDPDRFRQDLDLNLTSAYAVARLVLPGMVARGGGSIVNIASVNAVLALGNPSYSAAKAGLVSLTQQLATEYGHAGVRANAVLPGTVRTPIWEHRIAARPDVFEKVQAWYPIGRVGRPEDIAAAVAFLASDEAGFVTGAALLVDGGLSAGLYRMIRDITGT